MTSIRSSDLHGSECVHANGDRQGHLPRYVRWDHIDSSVAGPVWFTDSSLKDANHNGFHLSRSNVQIGWLWEPRQLHPENYELALKLLNEGHLTRLFTHDARLLSLKNERILPYPHGGTRLHTSDWSMTWSKEPLISIVASQKRSLPGHRLRHDLIARIEDDDGVIAFGPEYVGIVHKADALKGFVYTVAIENVSDGVFFTEALLDAFLAGTFPIYYGSEDALKQWGFDMNGVIFCHNLSELLSTVRNPPPIRPREREAMEQNFIRAHEYTCPEDWLWRHYPEFFERDT